MGIKKIALCVTLCALPGCDPAPPVVAAVDTLCTSTSRYRATDAQVAAFKADRPLWEPLVDWLASFNKVRDGKCLAPSPY
ncbi:hypothetical protein [Reyranella sp.]|uniref:hypothetical protein n=1 Tax=Reyranella sp. TaxID=1929291 RepID=UPI001219A8CF|nr:hypothetical protein [Reyranella sp.]TAJ89750.1 MAG: hypothetical protein EPO50_05125 [Reyranella sp.]